MHNQNSNPSGGAAGGTPTPNEASPARTTQQQAGDAQPGVAVQQQATQTPADGEYGEGNYKATRDYNEGLKQHLATHDVEREARDAAPRSASEADELRRAEDVGRSHARGDDKGVGNEVSDESADDMDGEVDNA